MRSWQLRGAKLAHNSKASELTTSAQARVRKGLEGNDKETSQPDDPYGGSNVPPWGSVPATILFLGGFFFTGFRLDNEFFNFRLGYLTLAALIAMIAAGEVGARGGYVSTGVKVFYLLLTPTLVVYSIQGSATFGASEVDYAASALYYLTYVTVTVIYALRFFDASVFVRVWWLMARVSLAIALLGYLLAVTLPVQQLVVSSYGVTRLSGLLSEPSAWSGLLPAVLFVSLKRRSFAWFVAALLATYLTQSPTVLIGLAISVLLVVGTRSRFLGPRIVLVTFVGASVPLLLGKLSGVSSAVLMSSNNGAERVLGRLVSGVENLLTGGITGSNTRVDGIRAVIEALQQHPSWLYTGRGLGSSDVYFAGLFGDVRAYNLPILMTFDTGIFVATAFCLCLAWAIWRLRHSHVSLILFPLIVAASINSAQGIQTYKFVFLSLALAFASRSSRRGTGLGGQARSNHPVVEGGSDLGIAIQGPQQTSRSALE